jgi:hypothetical protein
MYMIEYYGLKAVKIIEDVQAVFIVAIFAFDTGKSVVQVATVQIPG